LQSISCLTIGKLKTGIFYGSQIRKLMIDACFVQYMTDTESTARPGVGN